MSVVACIQMASGPNIGANLLEAERLIHEAVSQKARLVVLPENFALMGNTEHDKVAAREKEGSGAIQTFLSEQSACHGIWLVGGTIPLVAPARSQAFLPIRVGKDAQMNIVGMRAVRIHVWKYVQAMRMKVGDVR